MLSIFKAQSPDCFLHEKLVEECQRILLRPDLGTKLFNTDQNLGVLGHEQNWKFGHLATITVEN